MLCPRLCVVLGMGTGVNKGPHPVPRQISHLHDLVIVLRVKWRVVCTARMQKESVDLARLATILFCERYHAKRYMVQGPRGHVRLYSLVDDVVVPVDFALVRMIPSARIKLWNAHLTKPRLQCKQHVWTGGAMRV